MTPTERKFYIAELAHKYFSAKKAEQKSDEPRHYLVEMALFGNDFHQPPQIVPVEVALTDNEYLRLLQWQLLNPNTGVDYYEEISDIVEKIEFEAEMRYYGEEEVGTYALYLTEVQNDAAAIFKSIDKEQLQLM
jgi:hypothetical protein